MINLSIKEKLEEKELKSLRDIASKSINAKRKREETPSDLRTEYQRDRDRILHSKSFRRLKHKTQVFLSPFDDHFRTRLTHTLEVSQIARTMARALELNEDLVEAISLGHDLGHTPFGHCGETVLNNLVTDGFHHNVQSVRVVEVLEDMNLCTDTIDGILTHTWGFKPETPEAQIVQYADKIAYINHDIEDSIRAGIITENDLPTECREYFSSNPSERLSKMIYAVVNNSLGQDSVSMDKECWEYTKILRKWMFENIYINSPAKTEENKAMHVVKTLFEYYTDYLSNHCDDKNKIERLVTDYISGMTDQYAIEKYKEKFIPKPFNTKTKDENFLKMLYSIDE
ncbi:MAG: deoxyguanosinetriphosphate triphosphohydrolase [Candidatus Gastranaerophilales bacterium]|nr:deoxyguanosinetriphosphate triphosphohydrolase [Candidatus Gastranaerophilales bacterium]